MPSHFDFKELNPATNTLASGSAAWRSPSNLAIIKYWGKYANQLPRNPSLSITLSNAYTETHVQYEVEEYQSDKPSLEFYFEGKPNEAFRQKIIDKIAHNIDSVPFLKNLHLTIESSNSFPHSSGIASSASSMSALALCLCTIEQQLFAEVLTEEGFYQKASFIARLFSGSACRSVFPQMALWGQTEIQEQSSDLFAVRHTGFHENFKDLHDDILIVSPMEKIVSSTEGHKLMDNHPFASLRYDQADNNLTKLRQILLAGDIWQFGKLAEDEALVLHALMMCSDPSYILMEANTINAINEIRKFRQHQKIPVFFSLDAGPNVHILYPDNVKTEAAEFIQTKLLQYSPEKRIIRDQMGPGPELLGSTFKLKKT